MDRADDLNGDDRFFIEQDVFDLRLNDPKTGKGHIETPILCARQQGTEPFSMGCPNI